MPILYQVRPSGQHEDGELSLMIAPAIFAHKRSSTRSKSISDDSTDEGNRPRMSGIQTPRCLCIYRYLECGPCTVDVQTELMKNGAPDRRIRVIGPGARAAGASAPHVGLARCAFPLVMEITSRAEMSDVIQDSAYALASSLRDRPTSESEDSISNQRDGSRHTWTVLHGRDFSAIPPVGSSLQRRST